MTRSSYAGRFCSALETRIALRSVRSYAGYARCDVSRALPRSLPSHRANDIPILRHSIFMLFGRMEIDDMRFHNHIALVTGAAGGIGRHLCSRLGQAGAHIGLIDRDTAALERLDRELKAAGIRCAPIVADVGNRDQARAAVEMIEKELGPIEILVAAAGISGSWVDNLHVRQFEEMVQTNFLGAVFSSEAALSGMLRRRHGHIVGLSSVAAFFPLPFQSAYCASKAALSSYLQCLRGRLRRSGVKVTVVHLGFVRTPMLVGTLAEVGVPTPLGTIEPEVAAEKIIAAIRRGRQSVYVPRLAGWLAALGRGLPPTLYDWVTMRVRDYLRLPH
jgi:short-subunit dehydrogenase